MALPGIVARLAARVAKAGATATEEVGTAASRAAAAGKMASGRAKAATDDAVEVTKTRLAGKGPVVAKVAAIASAGALLGGAIKVVADNAEGNDAEEKVGAPQSHTAIANKNSPNYAEAVKRIEAAGGTRAKDTKEGTLFTLSAGQAAKLRSENTVVAKGRQP